MEANLLVEVGWLVGWFVLLRCAMYLLSCIQRMDSIVLHCVNSIFLSVEIGLISFFCVFFAV